MRRLAASLLCLLTVSPAWSSDACSTRAIVTQADVAASDGTAFKTESFFQSANAAAIRHIRDDEVQTIAVEGPASWATIGERVMLGGDFQKVFALGHQYHAFLLYFDEIVTNIGGDGDFRFKGASYEARHGDYPYGGSVTLVEGAQHPVGLVFEFPEVPPIVVSLDDWREVGDLELPFLVSIDDGERVFDYRYSRVDVADKSPLWFFETVESPGIDEVDVYRLHRKLLAAHCLGNSDMMADLSSPSVMSANNGSLTESAREEIRERFAGLFELVDYTGYHDLVEPRIEVSSAGDLGWIGVNVRAVGSVRETGATFDSEWAWIMVVQKDGDAWYHAGNASNRQLQE